MNDFSKSSLVRSEQNLQNYQLTEIGYIPKDWNVLKLESLVTYRNGVAHEDCIETSGEYVVVNSKFISTGGDVKKYSSQCRLSAFSREILMVMSDVPNGKAIAKCYFVKDNDLLTINQRICALKSINSDSKYLFYVLNRNAFYLAFDDGAKQTNLRRQDVLDCPLAIPSRHEEQTAIANALSDVDALIQELEKLIAKKQAIKTATMQQLLTGRTRLPQFAHHPDGRKKGYKSSELGEIPEDWEVCEFGSLLQEFRNGYAFSADGYEQTGIPIITMAQIGLSGCFQFDIAKVNKWDMNQLDKLKEFWVQNGDLLIAMTDVTPDKNLIGQMTIAKLDCVAFLNQRVGLLRMRTGVADATFFSFLSCLPVWKQYCRGVASLGVQANIGTTDIRKAKVYCPPIGEQAAITRILSDMDSEIQAQQHRLDKTRQIKQGMMQELLTGRIRLVQSLNEVMHE